MAKMKRNGLLLLLCLHIMLSGCDYNSNRKIKLATYTSGALMREQVATIQIAAAQKKGVAIVYFQNNTGRSNLDWLEQGIAEMVGTNLSQSRQVHLFTLAKVSDVRRQLGIDQRLLADPSVQLQLAQSLKAENYICGKYELTHDSLTIELELHDGQSGQILSRHIVKGSGLENVFTMVDQLTKDLRVGLQLTLRENREVDYNIADVATHSLEAYKAYSMGVEARDKIYNDEAKQYFQKAIQIDSTFASAYLQLAAIYLNQGKTDKSRELLRKAVRYSERAPMKERLRILALNSAVDGNYYTAIENYNKILEIYPEDDDAHLILANYYRAFMADYEKAIEHYEAAIALNPRSKIAYNQLLYTYENIGKLDYAIDAFNKYVLLAQDEPNPYDSMGEVLQIEGRIDDAISYFKKALKKNKEFAPSRIHLALAYLDAGQPKKTKQMAKYIYNNAQSDDDRIQALVLQIKAAVFEENFEKARNYVSQLYELKPFDIGVLTIYNILDADYNNQRERLQKLLTFLQDKALKNDLLLSELFGAAVICLHLNEGLDVIQLMLDDMQRKTTEPHQYLSIIGFKNAIAFCLSDISGAMKSPISQIGQEYLKSIPPVSWEGYWRYYYSNLARQIPDTPGLSEYIKKLRNNARDAASLQFVLAYTTALASIKKTQKELDASQAELRSIGLPEESDFRCVGPFHVTKSINQSFWPEEVAVETLHLNEVAEWPTSGDGQMDGYIDLKKILGFNFNQCGYALLQVHVANDMDVFLRMGINRPLKVWLNNNLVLTKNEIREAYWDEIKIPVHMKSGVNWMLIKMTSLAGECGFYFRLTNEDGSAVPGITFGERIPT
jgi:tetratricopeptide (TPR) repeat protein